ncbi:hypothetical protein JCM17380_16890 [Desulfosporosinus burensis]
MHEMFKYDRVKKTLCSNSYAWESAIAVLEKLINVPDIILTYPINLYDDDWHGSVSVFFFTRNYIYHMYFQSGNKEFPIRVFKSENISEIVLSIKGESAVSLKIVLKDEYIVLSSQDAPNNYTSHKYADALVQIGAIFSK